MLLAELVGLSDRVASTRARLEKVRMLAELLRKASPGRGHRRGVVPLRHTAPGAIRLGHSAVHGMAEAPPAIAPGLGLLEVDQAFGRMGALKGPGSAG